MKINNRLWILLLPIFLLATITCNSLQTSNGNNDHSHTDHDLIIHIHQHSHSVVTHSHYHSSMSTFVLDYFLSQLLLDKLIELKNDENSFELKQLHAKELINKLLKPPKYS